MKHLTVAEASAGVGLPGSTDGAPALAAMIRGGAHWLGPGDAYQRFTTCADVRHRLGRKGV